MTENKQPTKYQVLERTLRNVGEDVGDIAVDAGGLMVELIEANVYGLLPGDLQKALTKGKKEGYAEGQSIVSAISEAVIGMVTTVSGMPIGIPILADGLIRGALAASDIESSSRKNMPLGSLFLELPYLASKKAKSYLTKVYDESTRELVEEHNYRQVEVTSK